jgi:hypothetical protein
METLIVHLKSAKKAEALKSVMKALDVRYESRKKGENPYDPEFVAKIKGGEEDYTAGRYMAIKTEELRTRN